MEKLLELTEKYWDKFEKPFPTMFFLSEDTESLYSIIEKCLEKELTAEELYDLPIDNDIFY